jgi:preprotein translocase subunit SecE
MSPESTEVKQENGLQRWIRETRAELSKVTWPTREQWLQLTGIVIITTIISAIVVFGVDSLFSTIIGAIVNTL